MPASAHPNLFPGISAPIDGTQPTADSPSDARAAVAGPWSNSFTRRIDGEDEPAANASPSESTETPAKRMTRTEQVLAHLRVHGPSTSGEICRALGIDNRGGIGPFIVPAVRTGRIVRIGGKYGLPDGAEAVQSAAAPASTAKPVERKVKRSAPPRLPDAAPASNETPKPDFVLFVDELQLLSYADGSVVLQSEQARIEVQPRQMKAFLVLAQLRA